jgi:chromosome segregation ATPase
MILEINLILDSLVRIRSLLLSAKLTYGAVKCGVQRARDELAKQVLLLEEKLVTSEEALQEQQQDDVKRKQTKDGRLAGRVDLENELQALQNDVDVLLQEIEKERAINKGLEKMIRDSDKETRKLEAKLDAASKKIEKLKSRKKWSNEEEEEESKEELIVSLRKKISVLTESRSRLISSLDASADEVDRITKENEALAETATDLRDACQAWEAQVQENISLSNRLKDLLEEGSEWKAPPGGDGSPISLPVTPGKELSDSEKENLNCKALEYNVLQWQKKCSTLEVHVMALCAELNRLSTSASGMQASIVPLLSNIESRIESLSK